MNLHSIWLQNFYPRRASFSPFFLFWNGVVRWKKQAAFWICLMAFLWCPQHISFSVFPASWKLDLKTGLELICSCEWRPSGWGWRFLFIPQVYFGSILFFFLCIGTHCNQWVCLEELADKLRGFNCSCCGGKPLTRPSLCAAYTLIGPNSRRGWNGWRKQEDISLLFLKPRNFSEFSKHGNKYLIQS